MKTAIVFGATSGIGREISELLLKDGYKVAITGRRLEKLEALKNQYSNQVYIVQNDIQKVDEVENVFNKIIKEFIISKSRFFLKRQNSKILRVKSESKVNYGYFCFCLMLNFYSSIESHRSTRNLK